jgi:hypothetical protein
VGRLAAELAASRALLDYLPRWMLWKSDYHVTNTTPGLAAFRASRHGNSPLQDAAEQLQRNAAKCRSDFAFTLNNLYPHLSNAAKCRSVAAMRLPNAAKRRSFGPDLIQ